LSASSFLHPDASRNIPGPKIRFEKTNHTNFLRFKRISMSALLDLLCELRDEILDLTIHYRTQLHSSSRPLSIFQMSKTPTPSRLHHPARGLLLTCHQLRSETLQRNAINHHFTIEFDAVSECYTAPCTSISMPLQVGPVIEKVFLNCRLRPVCLKTMENGSIVRSKRIYDDTALAIFSEPATVEQVWRNLLRIIHGTPGPRTRFHTPAPQHAITAVHLNLFNERSAQTFVNQEERRGRRYGLLNASILAKDSREALV
jgi:hypothetical protein